MNLKQYANKHVSGGVTWYLMPYTTLSFQNARDQFMKSRPIVTWSDAEYTFVWLEGYAVDLEFADTLTAEEQRLADYWNNRPSAIMERWHAFSFLVDTDTSNTFWVAFEATRNKQIESVEPVLEAEIPNSAPASVND